MEITEWISLHPLLEMLKLERGDFECLFFGRASLGGGGGGDIACCLLVLCSGLDGRGFCS